MPTATSGVPTPLRVVRKKIFIGMFNTRPAAIRTSDPTVTSITETITFLEGRK
jgi:hypothetical protein